MPIKPRYLYHGSPTKVKILEPRQGCGMGPHPDDKKTAVFATNDKMTACIFALSPIPDKKGLRWGFDSPNDGKIRIYVYKGRLNPTG